MLAAACAQQKGQKGRLRNNPRIGGKLHATLCLPCVTYLLSRTDLLVTGFKEIVERARSDARKVRKRAYRESILVCCEVAC